MQVELNSLMRQVVFGLVVQTPKGAKPIGYKWVFVQKCNENNEIIRYKTQSVAQVSRINIVLTTRNYIPLSWTQLLFTF